MQVTLTKTPRHLLTIVAGLATTVGGMACAQPATGELTWEHKRPSGASRAKTLAIYQNMGYYTAPDGFIVALDAKTGAVRWETPTTGQQISGPLVVDGKVLTGEGIVTRLLIQQAGINPTRGYNAIDVFALPVTR